MQVPRKTSQPEDNNHCPTLSPLVMALFDGEADELQARRARAHLLVCQTCANRWLDWNRARSLLVSVPSPAPPETLVWRVLMACRQATLGRSQGLQSQHHHAEVKLGSTSVPLGLSDQILARTTRPDAAPTLKNRSWNRSWPALALPSVAFWLLVLQREPLLSSFLVQNSSRLAGAASSRPAPPRRGVAPQKVASQLKASSQSFNSSPRRLAVPENAQVSQKLRAVEAVSSVRLAPSPPVDSTPSSPQTANLRTPDIALTRQWQEIQVLTASASRPAEVRLVAAPVSRRAVFGAQLEVATLPRQRRGVAVSRRGAQFSDEPAVPRLRTAQWRVSTPRIAGLAEIQSPQVVPSRVSLPNSSAPTATRLVSENLDADDGRVDEMRSVVDDFRAALAPEETPPLEDDEEWG